MVYHIGTVHNYPGTAQTWGRSGPQDTKTRRTSRKWKLQFRFEELYMDRTNRMQIVRSAVRLLLFQIFNVSFNNIRGGRGLAYISLTRQQC